MKRAEPTQLSATSVAARCLGLLLLVVMAFVPMGASAAKAPVVIDDAGPALAEESEEDCDELVSHDMVLCGEQYFEHAQVEQASLMMPREQCQELLETLTRGLECDPDDAKCRERQARRGDLAPETSRTLRVLPMALAAAVDFDLSLVRGVTRRVSDWDMPSSLAMGPPPRPPRAA